MRWRSISWVIVGWSFFLFIFAKSFCSCFWSDTCHSWTPWRPAFLGGSSGMEQSTHEEPNGGYTFLQAQATTRGACGRPWVAGKQSASMWQRQEAVSFHGLFCFSHCLTVASIFTSPLPYALLPPWSDPQIECLQRRRWLVLVLDLRTRFLITF